MLRFKKYVMDPRTQPFTGSTYIQGELNLLNITGNKFNLKKSFGLPLEASDLDMLTGAHFYCTRRTYEDYKNLSVVPMHLTGAVLLHDRLTKFTSKGIADHLKTSKPLIKTISKMNPDTKPARIKDTVTLSDLYFANDSGKLKSKKPLGSLLQNVGIPLTDKELEEVFTDYSYGFGYSTYLQADPRLVENELVLEPLANTLIKCLENSFSTFWALNPDISNPRPWLR